MLTNESIVTRWSHGLYGKNGNMYTNGYDLYSYNMLIGKTFKGQKISLDIYSLNVSHTTNTHIRLANKYSNQVISAQSKGYSTSSYYRYSFPQEKTIDLLKLVDYEGGYRIENLTGIALSLHVFQNKDIAEQCLNEALPYANELIDPVTNQFKSYVKTQDLYNLVKTFPQRDKAKSYPKMQEQEEIDPMSTDKLIILHYTNDVWVIATKDKQKIFSIYPFKTKQAARHCIRYVSALAELAIDDSGYLSYYSDERIAFLTALDEYYNIDKNIQQQEERIKSFEKELAKL